MPTPTLPLAPMKIVSLTDAKRIVGLALSGLASRFDSIAPPVEKARAGFSYNGIRSAYGNRAHIMISRAFLNGDHWQGGYGWMGPSPQIDDPAYSETVHEIARGFVSKNAIAEVTARHVHGVIGIEPSCSFAPRDALPEGTEVPKQTQDLIREADAIFTGWWDKRLMWEMMQTATQTMLYAERATIRLYIPAGMLTEEPEKDSNGAATGRMRKVVVAASVEEALDLIYPDHPAPENAAVVQDDSTKQYIGAVVFRLLNLDGTMGQEQAEITFVDGEETVVRVIGEQSNGGAGVVDYRFTFGGLLPMYEMHRPLFVTPQMWQQQKAMNLAESMVPRTIVTAGFLERTIMNAQMPGEWETDDSGRKTRFKPAPYYVGPGTTNFLQGLEVPDQDGNMKVATPSVHVREPSPSTGVIDASRANYTNMLEEASQEHTLAYENAKASGKTHEQARADYLQSLRRTRSRLEGMGRWLMETLFTMGETLSGQEGRFTTTLRSNFTCRLDVGPITSDERTANDASVKAGTLSVESAISRNGEADPDAELARIHSQPGAGLAVVERQAAVILSLTQAGATLKGAAQMAGVDDKLLTELIGDGVPPVPPSNAPPIPPA